MAVGPASEVMKDAWVEVAVGLFFTSSPSSGLLSCAQQEHNTPCLLIHISHIPAWIKRRGRWKREAKMKTRRERFDTDGWASAGEKDWHAAHGGTHNSTKRTTNQAQNWHTLADKGCMTYRSMNVQCVSIRSSYLEEYVSYCVCVLVSLCAPFMHVCLSWLPIPEAHHFWGKKFCNRMFPLKNDITIT